MKLLAVYPYHNQEIRIQPLFKIIHKELSKHISEHLFINENSSDNSAHVIKLEYEKLNQKYKYIHIDKETSRAESIITALEYAHSQNYDYIVCFNEGWEDNIFEILSIIRSGEFIPYNITVSRRDVKDLSIGSMIDKISSFLLTLKFETVIKESKGDSINILRVEDFKLSTQQKEKMIKAKEDFFLYLLKYSPLKVLFTIVDNGYNYPSYLKLNLKRMINVIKFIIQE